jgi:hypothetical protein
MVKYAQKNSTDFPKGKKPLRRPGHRWEKIDLGELKNEGLWRDFSWLRIWFSCGNEVRISLSSWRKRTS